jgi:Zn-dependent M28 family amino/carboxypeptidase
MTKTSLLSSAALLDGQPIDGKKIAVLALEKEIHWTEKSGVEIKVIGKEENFFQQASKILASNKPSLVLIDEAFASNLPRLANRGPLKSTQAPMVFLVASKIPVSFDISVQQTIIQMPLANVVGIIPGKTLAKEYVIFSGHYDHLGINSKGIVQGDSIFNGANDDAAGTTGMIMLAKYFKKLNNNARTLIFAAFTAEEVGGFGASYFSKVFDPLTVKAMFNLEMIGTESKWGKNSAYITGFEKSDMGAILQKNLVGTPFQFFPDPYTDQNLFYRSDNATLARLGVPAHTISTSKMDSEPHYHKASDEVKTLDLTNMTEVIKAIAKSAESIISGKDTPSRVDTSQLK